MKITQINTVVVGQRVVVIGLGENQKIYAWSGTIQDWVLFDQESASASASASPSPSNA